MKTIILIPIFLFFNHIIRAQIVNEGKISNSYEFNVNDNISNFDDNLYHFNINPIEEIYLKDSILLHYWDEVNHTWLNPVSRRIYNYNNAGYHIYTKFSSRSNGLLKWRDTDEIYLIRDQNELPIEYHQNKFDTITYNWIPNRYDTITYNNNKVVLTTSSTYNKLYNQWHRTTYYKCNNEGYLLESYELSWDYQSNHITFGFWNNHVLNSQNKQIELVVKLYDSYISDWRNYYKQILSYQNDSILDSYSTYDWNNTDQAWKLKSQDLYSYSNNILASRIKQTWDGLNWNNAERILYEYNSDNLLSKTVNQIWNNSSWLDWSQELLSYDTNKNVSERLNQVFSNDHWVNNSLFVTTYNAKNQILELINKYWDFSTGQITSGSSKATYTYNNSELNTEINHQKWDTSVIDWVNSYKEINYYSNHHSSGIISLTNEDIILFPNPANSRLIISGIPGDSEISIYNLSGLLLLNKQLESNQIDISGLKRGTYVLKIINPIGTFTKQFLKL